MRSVRSALMPLSKRMVPSASACVETHRTARVRDLQIDRMVINSMHGLLPSPNVEVWASTCTGPLVFPHEMQTAEDAVRLQLNAIRDNHVPRANHGVQV